MKATNTAQKSLSVKLGDAVRLRPQSGKERERIGQRTTSISKVDRYGWTVKDKPGVFKLVPKDQLSVDRSYQREQYIESKVLDMAANWSWVACGCLIVAQREGVYYIVEGQHRCAAAKRRADIKELPCLVFELESIAQEARGFLDANTARKPLQVYDKFRAMLLAGDKVAVRAKQIMDTHSYAPSATRGDGRTVRCLRAFLDCIQRDEAALCRIFPLVIKACDESSIDERILCGMFYLERNCTESITTPRWEKRIEKFKKRDYISAITRTIAAYERGGDRLWAMGVLLLLNKSLSGDRMLKLKEST